MFARMLFTDAIRVPKALTTFAVSLVFLLAALPAHAQQQGQSRIVYPVVIIVGLILVLLAAIGAATQPSTSLKSALLWARLTRPSTKRNASWSAGKAAAREARLKQPHKPVGQQPDPSGVDQHCYRYAGERPGSMPYVQLRALCIVVVAHVQRSLTHRRTEGTLGHVSLLECDPQHTITRDLDANLFRRRRDLCHFAVTGRASG